MVQETIERLEKLKELNKRLKKIQARRGQEKEFLHYENGGTRNSVHGLERTDPEAK